MSDEEKLPYQTKAHDDTLRYREAMTVWKDGGAGVCRTFVPIDSVVVLCK